jgi:hypothetical protein
VLLKVAPTTRYDQVSYCSSGNRADHLHHTGVKIGTHASDRTKFKRLTASPPSRGAFMCFKTCLYITLRMARQSGFEPEQEVLEASVLPLHY